MPDFSQWSGENFSDAGPERPMESQEAALAENAKKTAPAAPIDPYAQALQSMDFAALRQVNPDVLGWILVPGTKISYPLVHSSEKEGDFYLNHTWSGDFGSYGAIFLDPGVSPDFSGFNTVIYGHNMKDGPMFAALKGYGSQAFLDAHPEIYITLEAGPERYRVFAAYRVSTGGEAFAIGFSSREKRQELLDFALEGSVISAGFTPSLDSKIITLSTCTGQGHETRWVVQAELKED